MLSRLSDDAMNWEDKDCILMLFNVLTIGLVNSEGIHDGKIHLKFY
jgi:hypothetical protein